MGAVPGTGALVVRVDNHLIIWKQFGQLSALTSVPIASPRSLLMLLSSTSGDPIDDPRNSKGKASDLKFGPNCFKYVLATDSNQNLPESRPRRLDDLAFGVIPATSQEEVEAGQANNPRT